MQYRYVLEANIDTAPNADTTKRTYDNINAIGRVQPIDYANTPDGVSEPLLYAITCAPRALGERYKIQKNTQT